MQVVGMTNEREVWIASNTEKFRLNELVIIEDEELNNPVGEVIETYALNPFIPGVDEKSSILVDQEVVASLSSLGYNLEEEMIYTAKVRILSELFYPISTGAKVRYPCFAEVEELLLKTSPDKGLALGVILGTEGLTASLPLPYRRVAPLYEKGEIKPQTGVPFIFDYRAMNNYPHIGVFGGSGSGKSFGLRVLIEELIKKRVPLLVFDPHYEMSFNEVFHPGLPDDFKETFADRCLILTVGDDTGVKFEALTPADLCNLLSAVSPITEAMENAVTSILERGDSFTTFNQRLNDLMSLLESPNDDDFKKSFMASCQNIDEKKREAYLNRLMALKKQVGQLSTLKSINWRLNRLERQGIFRDQGIRQIEEGLKAQKAVIVRGSIWMLKVYAAYVLRSLYGKRRVYRDALQKGERAEEKFPPFVVVTDEAHNFAPRGEQNVPSRREIREIAQEGRKYGVFLVLATQRPALLDDTVNAQLNTKIIFRTVRSHDLNVIREETDMGSEEIKRLPYLPSGTGFVSSPVFGRTIPIRVRAAKTSSPHQINPFDELETVDERDGEIMNIIKECLPVNASNLVDLIQRLEACGFILSQERIINYLDMMVERGEIKREENRIVGYIYRLA
ncbi:hypothetical protein SAMN02745221_01447 [Thermosyntropha lipolytica DSM 11003]|uniref:FtsK domain-containing protein n=1 Tax=Thermosyntropha lipolytica DSM 11003 TaxID=1123382 RepID=A0A1M5PE61_9FIRM|nr:ATP-binding protein [Thermosyntropha lipolytica]SHH00042.1 hypothetical protein SAMN02745221_01447 [Thermosyntropha lipolytica DSM 11003]